MTTSQEKDIDQARKAIEDSKAIVPYSASQGYGRNGVFTSRVDRLEFDSRYTWRDIAELVDRARGAMTAGALEEFQPARPSTERPATFLYAVRRAMLRSRLTHNGLPGVQQETISTRHAKGKGPGRNHIFLRERACAAFRQRDADECHAHRKTHWRENAFPALVSRRAPNKHRRFVSSTRQSHFCG